MKRAFTLIFCIIVCLVLSGCGGSPETVVMYTTVNNALFDAPISLGMTEQEVQDILGEGKNNAKESDETTFYTYSDYSGIVVKTKDGKVVGLILSLPFYGENASQWSIADKLQLGCTVEDVVSVFGKADPQIYSDYKMLMYFIDERGAVADGDESGSSKFSVSFSLDAEGGIVEMISLSDTTSL